MKDIREVGGVDPEHAASVADGFADLVHPTHTKRSDVTSCPQKRPRQEVEYRFLASSRSNHSPTSSMTKVPEVTKHQQTGKVSPDEYEQVQHDRTARNGRKRSQAPVATRSSENLESHRAAAERALVLACEHERRGGHIQASRQASSSLHCAQQVQRRLQRVVIRNWRHSTELNRVSSKARQVPEHAECECHLFLGSRRRSSAVFVLAGFVCDKGARECNARTVVTLFMLVGAKALTVGHASHDARTLGLQRARPRARAHLRSHTNPNTNPDQARSGASVQTTSAFSPRASR
jgi:hypothetical protein